MTSRQKAVPPAERERYRRWLLKLSHAVDTALDDRDDLKAAAEVRAMLLSAIAAVGTMDRRAQVMAERRERQLATVIERLRSAEAQSRSGGQ